jgi:hypothetical protein
MTDLFSYQPPERYPDKAGWRGKATSRAAAESIDPHLSRLEQIVIDAIRDHGPMTADEVAAVAGISILSSRPRCSMLAKDTPKRKAILEDSGETRPSSTGNPATVWRLKESA